MESIAFKSGKEAAEQKIKLKESALKNLQPGTNQYDDFIDGYDSVLRKYRIKIEKLALALQLPSNSEKIANTIEFIKRNWGDK